MILYWLKWSKVVKGGITISTTDAPFDTYHDAYHAIKAMHTFAGLPFELTKVSHKNGLVVFHNTRTQMQFVICWESDKPKEPKKKKENYTEQLFY